MYYQYATVNLPKIEPHRSPEEVEAISASTDKLPRCTQLRTCTKTDNSRLRGCNNRTPHYERERDTQKHPAASHQHLGDVNNHSKETNLWPWCRDCQGE